MLDHVVWEVAARVPSPLAAITSTKDTVGCHPRHRPPHPCQRAAPPSRQPAPGRRADHHSSRRCGVPRGAAARLRPEAELEACYADDKVESRLSADGTYLSSPSAPSLQALMIEQATLQSEDGSVRATPRRGATFLYSATTADPPCS